MKKSIKLIFLFIISLVMIFIGKETVFAADSAPSTFVAVSSRMSTQPKGLSGFKSSIKKTSAGKFIYCNEVYKSVPNNVTYSKGSLVTDPVINYIIGSGTEDKTENEFFATQAALWIYLYDNGKMSDPEGYIAAIKSAMKNYPNEAVYQDISNILSKAKSLGKYYMEDIEITQSNVSLDESDLSNGKYISNVIEVNKMIGDYEIKLNNAPYGTMIVKRANGFIVQVPESSISEGITSFTVSVSAIKYNTYVYSTTNSKYQNMLAAYPDASSDIVRLTVTKEVEPEPEDPTKIVISKQDITNKGTELKGATLVIKNSDGKVVETWVSGDTPKEFDSLPVGKYTLSETYAPEGYQLSTETINFEVQQDGSIEKVVMYNTPEKVEEIIVKISKQDITNGKELEGATLVVRNSKGEIIDEWVSGNEPHIIKGLEEGTYTLEETIAPKGYKLSSEKITFEVKNNGVVTEVVMYNTPESTTIVDVPPTGSFASSIPYIIGGLVIIIGSVLVYRNAKKEQ